MSEAMATPKNDRAAIVQVICALKKAGWNPVSITYPETVMVKGKTVMAKTKTPGEIADLITDNYFSAVLYFKKDGSYIRPQWVYFVPRNGPDEVVCDYTMSNNEFDTIVTTLIESW